MGEEKINYGYFIDLAEFGKSLDSRFCDPDCFYEYLNGLKENAKSIESELTRLREENELLEKEVVRLKEEYSRECCEHQDCIMDRDKYKRALDGIREENEKMRDCLEKVRDINEQYLTDDDDDPSNIIDRLILSSIKGETTQKN